MMLARTLAVFCLVSWAALWSGVVVGQADQLVRFRVAVLDFDVNDLTGTIREPERLGRAMATEFETPLVQSRRFVVITRLDLEKVLDELALGPTGILNPDQVKTFGEVAGVDVIITGNITVFGEASFGISARFIDVGTGELGDAETLRASRPEEFFEVAQRFVQRALVRYPLRGGILHIDGALVYIDLGIAHGLTARDEGGVIYRPRTIGDRTILERVGTFRVAQIYEEATLVVPTMEAGEEVRLGDVVSVQQVTDAGPEVAPEPAATEAPRDDGAVATDTEASAAPDPETPAVTEPEAAMEPAEPSQPSEPDEPDEPSQPDEPSEPDEPSQPSEPDEPDEPDEPSQPDEPMTGRVTLALDPPDAHVIVDGVERGPVLALPPGNYRLVVRADGYLEQRFELTVAAGDSIERDVTLTRQVAVLTLTTEPPDARVALDGVAHSQRELALEPGVHTLTVEADGFEPFQRRLVLTAGQQEHVAVVLQPSPATLVFVVDADDYRVRVGNEVYAQPPEVRLQAGVHEMVIEAPGHLSVSLRVDVAAGERRVLEIAMVRDLPAFTTLSAGGAHTLALDQHGNAWAWGSNASGQLGDGSTTDHSSPNLVPVPTGTVFTTLSVGDHHSLALDADGNAWAWGRNLSGQLGDGTTTDHSTPVPVRMPAGTTFTSLSAGRAHSLALDADGNAWSWGSNASGQLGDGSTTDHSSPNLVRMPAGTTFTSLSAGGFHSLALDADGNAWSWGGNASGQLGDSTTTYRAAPVRVHLPAGSVVTSLSAGGAHSLAVDASGTAWAWGRDDYGQLGGGTTTSRSTPLRVPAPRNTTFTTVCAGHLYSLALDTDGNAWSWGSNASGQLGDGTTTNRGVPVRVRMPAATTFSTVTAERLHSLALDTDGNAWAWGSNASGQLGDGTTSDHNVPARVRMP